MEISILSPLQLILLLLRVTTLHAQVNCREQCPLYLYGRTSKT